MITVVTGSVEGIGPHCRHWNKQHGPFVLQEQWGRDQIRVFFPMARPHTAPACLSPGSLFPITVKLVLICLESTAGAVQWFWIAGMFYPS